ncbi:MAG: Gfo/Idh/MocA family oxidoreductase [Verrucomicrobia bacterium]|nr:Gfo/Idh/MocA family oxidoreductase [Verrucomicrobiota bacterium]
MNPTPRLPTEHEALLALNRRRFLTTAGTVTAGLTLMPGAALRSAEADHRIKIGLIGCGGRGRWITNLFARHGGYEVVGVFDYFPDRANQAGDQFQVPAAARYTGLYGYRKLLEQPGLDAVVIQSPPFFHPEQAQDAVAAGKHVYLAKPIAVDVPGCQSIGASGAQATTKRLVFLVDFRPAPTRLTRRSCGACAKVRSASSCWAKPPITAVRPSRSSRTPSKAARTIPRRACGPGGLTACCPAT